MVSDKDSSRISVPSRRTQKMLSEIRDTFLEMAEQMSYDDITVSEICRRVDITRKTFYRYYPGTDDLVMSVCAECADEIIQQISEAGVRDLEGALLIYYSFLESAQGAIKRLISDRDFCPWFAGRMNRIVFTSDFFMGLIPDGADDVLMEGYFEAAYGIYLAWRSSDKGMDIAELSRIASDMLMNGIRP